jgi:hypothetical protein
MTTSRILRCISPTYAWQIETVLPYRKLSHILPDGTHQQTTSYYMYYGENPRIGCFKVYGYPCIIKVYVRENQGSAASSQTLTSKNII